MARPQGYFEVEYIGTQLTQPRVTCILKTSMDASCYASPAYDGVRYTRSMLVIEGIPTRNPVHKRRGHVIFMKRNTLLEDEMRMGPWMLEQ